MSRRKLLSGGVTAGAILAVNEQIHADGVGLHATSVNIVTDGEGVLHLGPRTIPLPRSVSPQARDFLIAASKHRRPVEPPADDRDAWQRHVAATMLIAPEMIDHAIAATGCTVEMEKIAGVVTYVATPPGGSKVLQTRVYFDFHGGALVYGGGKAVSLSAAMMAAWTGCLTYSIDYRMPPDHPFPAALDDAFTVYREIINRHDPKSVAVGGGSAGGNLAAALALKVRDSGVPLPACLVLLSPELDLTESGDTFETIRDIDVVLWRGLPIQNALYAAGQDLADPYLSPLFGDFSKGYPPTFIHSGTRDIFLSNSVRMQRALRRAGIEVDLQLWEAMPHAGFGLGPSPEMDELAQEIRNFLSRHLPA